MNKKIIIFFGIIFLIFGVIVLFQINTKSINNFVNKSANPTVTINSTTFRVEIAKTQKERVEGLSGREGLPANTGMLFQFENPSYYSFWMRGMKFPLDIIYILDDKVVAVFEDLPPASPNDDNPIQYGSNIIADSVLEINAGEAKKNNIKVGDTAIIKIN